MIKHITYHILNKEQQGEGKIELNPNKIEPSPAHKKFLEVLNKAYASKAGKGYGKFNSDEDKLSMPKYLSDYLSDNNFENLAKNMMDILLRKINLQPLATGGKVFITHYELQGHSYILIAILSDKTGFSANDWNLKESEVLDIEHLKFAGRINLSSWLSDNDDIRYVSFLKGQREIAAYFKEFLACTDMISNNAETKHLVSLLLSFTKEQSLDLDRKTDFLSNCNEYLVEISNNNEPFELESFANRVWPDNPQVLKDKLGDPEDGIADGFVPHKTEMKKLTTYSGRTKHWRLTFDNEAISDGQITRSNGKIIINQPPDELLEAFE